jgi:hypothetical protein
MDIIIGRGNSRAKFEVATGQQMKALAKTDPIEHTKILGNLKALVRAQPKIGLSSGQVTRLKKGLAVGQ